MLLGERNDVDLDFVQFRSAHEGLDPPLLDLQVHHRTVANVSPAARQAVFVIAVALEVRTPGLAPEGRGDGSAHDADGGNRLPLPGSLGDFLRRSGAPLSHGNIRPESVIPAHECLLPLVIPISRRTPDAD